MNIPIRNTPSFDEQFSELNQFILNLVKGYQARRINSWDDLEKWVKEFFTPQQMENMETRLPGWQKMASYSDGITLVHVMCVFLGMYMMPEYLSLTQEQKNLMKWVILLHDVDKFHIRGRKDSMHAFHSGVLAAKVLCTFGFPVTDTYSNLIDSWGECTSHALIAHDDTAPTPDNNKLPQILGGVEQLYGVNSSATLTIKTIVLHISLPVDKNYPTPAPLTVDEIRQFIDASLFPLLRVMMLSDNEGWSLFDPETRAQQRRDTLAAFEDVRKLIS